jgi:hypothetical protein
MPVTIHSLEIRFDVKGSDEQRFGELFTRAMRAWSEQDAARRRTQALAASERALGDRPADGAVR